MSNSTVHLSIPASLKGRWIKASRLVGMKLGDWIVASVEQAECLRTLRTLRGPSPMNVYPIAAHVLDSKYRGSGHALAAVSAGEVIDLTYLDDALPGFGDALDALADDDAVGRHTLAIGAITDDRLLPVVEQLRAQGSVHVGMCSSTEFVEL